MTQNCYPVTVNGNTCVQCDEVFGVVGVPTQTMIEPVYGWNASARSAATQAGDCYVEFDVPYSTGVIIGFASEYVDANPIQVQHGFYCFESSGSHWYAVIESGALLTQPEKRENKQQLFRIERVNKYIRYYVDNVLVHSQPFEQSRIVMVLACMYASNDGVG